MLKRYSLLGYIGLTLITCGIYQFFFIYGMQRQINVVCDGDGRNLDPALALFLSIVIPGIFQIFWYYTQAERLRLRGEFVGMRLDTGLSIVLWLTLGSCIIIGPLVAIAKFINNGNMVFDDYNRRNFGNQGYNPNPGYNQNQRY